MAIVPCIALIAYALYIIIIVIFPSLNLVFPCASGTYVGFDGNTVFVVVGE